MSGIGSILDAALDEVAILRGIPIPPIPKLSWRPWPRQTMALESLADETLYGGAAGGGKSHLLLGAARLGHLNSVIFRRTYPELKDSLIPRSEELFGDPSCYNQTDHLWRFQDGCRIAFRQLDDAKAVHKHQSAEYDFIAFDELTQFLEPQYLYMLSRLRTTKRGQRCRVMGATNPGGEGNDWVIARWRCWLDPDYKGVKANPGELRWFIRTDEGQDLEVPEGTPHAKSRTFIPARLEDNPSLPAEYRANLMMLPEPWRSQLLNGDWAVGMTDDAWQVIPSAWIRAAQERWRPDGGFGKPLDAIGVDVALRGDDYAVKAKRYGAWIAPLERKHGRSIYSSAQLVDWFEPDLRTEGGIANIDGVGWGEGAVALCDARGLKHRAVIASRKSERHAKANPKFGFASLKTEMAWSVREALDPSQGATLALPPDDAMARDLRSYRWQPAPVGAKVMAKDKQIEELGHSPDDGDAVLLAVCGFEPAGEVALPKMEMAALKLARKPRLVAPRPPEARWSILTSDLIVEEPRPGMLMRAIWVSQTQASGFAVAHRDEDGTVCVIEAWESSGRVTLEEVAKRVLVASRETDRGRRKEHDYSIDLISGTEEEAGSRGLSLLDATWRAMMAIGCQSLPAKFDSDGLERAAGWAIIERMCEASKRNYEENANEQEQLLIWSDEAIRALGEARIKVSAAMVDSERTLDSPICRCLRMMAIHWGGMS